MKASSPDSSAERTRLSARGRGDLYLGIALMVFMSALAYLFNGTLGAAGLIIMAAGLLGAVIFLVLAFKFPIWLGMIWFLSMSGLHTLGMLRMPGLPDFSFPRLFMIAVLLLIPLGVIVGKRVSQPPYLPDLLILGYTGYVFFNMNTIGDSLRFNTWLTSSFAPALAYMFARQYVKTEAHLRSIFVFFIIMTTYFWIVSFGEHFEIPAMVWPRQILDRNLGNPWFGRSRGPFIQPALFGQIIGMYLIVHLFFLTRKIKPVFKTLISANLGFGLIGLLYTYTRGGWLATAVGFAALAVLRPKFRKIMIVAAGIGMIVVSLGVFQPKNDEFLAERMETTNTIDNRLGFLANATRMIRDNPIFGVGYFRFNDYRDSYNQGTYIPLYGYIKKKAGADVSIHDIYIGRAAEEGLLGLSLFLAFYGAVAWEFLKRWRMNPQGDWYDRDTLAMFAAFATAYFVGGMIIDYRYFDLINVLPAFFAGIIVGFPQSEVVLRGQNIAFPTSRGR